MKKSLWFFLVIVLILLLGYFYLNFSRKGPLPVNLKKMIKLTSPVFQSGESIPQKYTCDGENVNPPLLINGVGDQVKSLVLIVDDPDAPVGTWTHWLVWNIDPKTSEIKENSLPAGAVLGKTDFGDLNYGGPCPPSGTHRYFFRLYGLDTVLSLSQGAPREKLESAMSGHIIDQGELMGKYHR